MSSAVSANTYQVVYDANASWADAKTAATNAGGYPVSITSSAEQAYVECLIAQSNPPGPGAFWVGLYEVTEGNYQWDNGETLGYTHWYFSEPNNGLGGEDRGHLLWSGDLSRRGFWNDANAAGYTGSSNLDINRMGYVIEIGPPGDPPPPCPCSVALPNTYQVVHDADASWTSARTAALNAGGYLATITSANEQSQIESQLFFANQTSGGQTNYFFGGYWIGLKEISFAEGVYVWDDGEPLSYTHWYPFGEPNNSLGVEDRGQMLWTFDSGRTGWWNDVPEAGYPSSESTGVARAGYVIEYGCPGAPTPPGDPFIAPVPMTNPWMLGWLSFALLGSAGFALRRRA